MLHRIRDNGAVGSSAQALRAAGITDPQLRDDFEVCRRLHAEHGRTFYLATRLLPPEKRPYVWALYGFARYADEVVDPKTSPTWGDDFLEGLSRGEATDPVGRAMTHTVRRWDIRYTHVEAFWRSLTADVAVTGYATYADLETYLYGSAAVIGLQVLPILEPLAPEAAARARTLAEAFRMTNFIRDVGEDLRRGRVYLPQEDLDAFGVTRETLERGVVTAPIRELLRFEVARTRSLYAFAEPGINMIHPTSRDGVRAAFVLNSEILDAIEAAHYQVLTQRVSVPLSRRLAVALPAWRHARSVRRAEGPQTTSHEPVPAAGPPS
ncbi:MAG: phytoene/squalene synthase family protein [Actinomycetota bacterium]|nr:phytoene/squalene synthase family protein [Actinomycetota bacterium]